MGSRAGDANRVECPSLAERVLLDKVGGGRARFSVHLAEVIDAALCEEPDSIRVHPTAKVTVLAGSHSHGQSHATTFAQLAAERLQCPIQEVEVVEGDTDRIPYGHGTWGSRSTVTTGMAVVRAADRIVAKYHTGMPIRRRCDRRGHSERRSDPAVPPGPVRLAQLALEDLAVGVLRQLGDEVDGRRLLV